MHLSIELYLKLRELIQYLSHFVSSLTASDVDNTLRVREFRKSLRNACLSATESSRNSTCSSQDGWIKSIKHSLSSKKWLSSLNFFSIWSWCSYRPEMAHSNFSL